MAASSPRVRGVGAKVVPVVVLVAMIAVACTTGSPATDSSAGPPTPSTATQAGSHQVPTWPNGALAPDPSVAPKGVDLQPLINPPQHQPASDDSAPIDPSKGIDNINHLVFIVMENRSFDEYFGTYPGADGIPMKNGKPTVCQPMPGGGCAYPYHDTNYIDQGGPHGHKASVMDYNNGKMDGFIRALDIYKNGCMLHPSTPPCGGLTGPVTADVQNPLPGFLETQATGQFANIRPNTDFYAMAKQGNLPSVSWVVPVKDAGDHPPDDISKGQAYVTSLINAVMNGPRDPWLHT